MLGDEFHAARDVTKTSSYRMDTFQTRELGVLGWIDGTNIKVGRAPARVATCDNPQRWATPFDLSKITAAAIPRTEIIYGYQQAGGEGITGFADAGVKGIVTAGTGPAASRRRSPLLARRRSPRASSSSARRAPARAPSTARHHGSVIAATTCSPRRRDCSSC